MSQAVMYVLLLLVAICQGQEEVESSLHSSGHSRRPNKCASFRLNGETNNRQNWLVPANCESYVRDYIYGGQYEMDIEAVANAAIDYFRNLTASKNDAVVFDIDETLLSNLEYYTEHHYGVEKFNVTSWNAWSVKCKATAFRTMVHLVEKIQKSNFSVILLTGRSEDERNCTVNNLEAQGYLGWASLNLRSTSERALSAKQYKSARRESFQRQGYHIVANFGDQWSDLLGSAVGERQFKIPNPMYYIP